MNRLFTFLKDPLPHFLALGLLLFALYAWINPGGGEMDTKRIVVNRDALLTFIQYRTKVFQPELAAARLDRMPDDELKRLINDYVREEALHREADALGLAADDYVIKQRMIQKLDFITQGFAEAGLEPTDQDLKAYFEAHKADYRSEPYVTFTHVFFDGERHGEAQALALANNKLGELQGGGVPFSDAPKHGERFPYGVNYVERRRPYVESHFGKEMADKLFNSKQTTGVWRGPFVSPYGAHLVMIKDVVPASTPSFDEVKARVLEDYKRAQIKEASEEAIGEIVATYDVEIDLGEPAGGALAAAKP